MFLVMQACWGPRLWDPLLVLRPSGIPARQRGKRGPTPAVPPYRLLVLPRASGSHPRLGTFRALTAVRRCRQPYCCKHLCGYYPLISMTPSAFNISKTTQIRSEQQESAAVSRQGTCQVSLPNTGLEDSSSQSFTSLIPVSSCLKTVFQGSDMLCLAAIPLAPRKSCMCAPCPKAALKLPFSCRAPSYSRYLYDRQFPCHLGVLAVLSCMSFDL